MYAGHSSSGNGSSTSHWSTSGGNSTSRSYPTNLVKSGQELASHQDLTLNPSMYPTTSTNEMAQYQQMLYQQRQQHQSAQHQAARQQQLLQQQQAELRSRELSIQAASNSAQGLSSMSHLQQQSSNAGSVPNSSNQFMSHGNTSMYGMPVHHGSSGGGIVSSVSSASVPHSSPNLSQHLPGMHSSRPSMAPPSSSSMNRSSSNNTMAPPRSSSNNMLPPSMIPSARGGKDRQSELEKRKREAFLQRKRERENLERTKLEEERYSKALFDAPIKEANTEDSMQVSNILGDHRDVHKIINNSTVSCIGIDYQPPTPATPYQHIIGEEDDEPPSNGNGNAVLPETQNSGVNQMHQHMQPPSSYYRQMNQQTNPYLHRQMSRTQNPHPSDTAGSSHLRAASSEASSIDHSSRLSQPMGRPSSQHQQHISPEMNNSVNNSQQLSPHQPHRRQMPQQRPPSHQMKPQNSNQLHNRQLINSAREMVQHGSSPGDPTTRPSSQAYQPNHPLENMLRLSNSSSSSIAHQKEPVSNCMVENQIRGANVPSSQGTTGISPLSKNMSSSANYGLKPHLQSPASIGSSYNSNKMKPSNGLPPLNMEAAKDESRKQDDILSKQGLQAIFNEMAVCPPPLSAIETPRISDHEGNNSKNLAPKYSFMSIVAPLTPIASTPSHEDIPTNTSTIGQTNHFKDPINVANPNLSEDSDSDQASFEPPKKTSLQLQPKSDTFNSNDSMQKSNHSSKQSLSENDASKFSKTSKSFGTPATVPISTPSINNDNSTTSEKKGTTDTTDKGASSSDTSSNSDSSDSESSSEDEDNTKNSGSKKPRHSESAINDSRSPNNSTHLKKTPNDESKLSSATARNVMPSTSPFYQNTTNKTNFDPISNGGNQGALEQETEDVENEEVYSLGNIYKKVIKSTHSPHSQPSPKISQGSDSVHGGNRSFIDKSIEDSPSNTTDLLDRQDEDDPMLEMLSNSNQQLPDYSDLIPNSGSNKNLYKANMKGSINESSPKKRPFKTLSPMSKEKKKHEPLVTNAKQAFLGKKYDEDTQSTSNRKKSKRKRSHEYEESTKRENTSLTTSGNDSSSNISSSGVRNRPTPKKFATPTLKLEDKNADEELGEDLMEIQSPSYGHKSSKRSQSSSNHKKNNPYISPRPAHNTVQNSINSKSKLPTSPYKDFANKRIETLQDPSLSVSSSSEEEDDKTDEDWKETERGPKRQKISSQNGNNTSAKQSPKMLSKSNRQGKGGNKTSPRKIRDIKSVISDKEYSNHSTNEDEFESIPRPAKGKGGKGNTASGVEKKQILGTLFGSRAIQQKKGVQGPNSVEKGSKSAENRIYDSSSETQVHEIVKEEQYDSSGVANGSQENSRLSYRSFQEHTEIQRPMVLCRIPLASLKSQSQNLNAIFEKRHRSSNLKPSKQLDAIATLVSPSTKQSNHLKDRNDNSAISVRDSSSEHSSSKKKRDRSRRDSSASSSVSLKSSKHVRKKRSQRHTEKGFSDSSSDSDNGGSIHSSTSTSHNKRRRKDTIAGDIETKSRNTPENLSNNLNVSEPRPSSSLSHTHRNDRFHDDNPEQTSSYHEVQYYGYNEDNQESDLRNSTRSPNTVENPMPSTSNGVKDTQSHQSRMMPPPNKKLFYSYVEQRKAEEEQVEDTEVDPTDYMVQGKGLKHEADKEPDRERQAMKYLQAVLHFILYAHANEQRNEKQGAFTIYQETLNLVKHVCRPFKNSEFGNFDNKLAVISLRCQSLLFLKLYKMRRHELKECQKIIGDHIQKASNASQSSVNQAPNDSTSPNNGAGNGNTISPTPSPAGSEGSVCSKSSGYTSAGEQNIQPGGSSTSLTYGRSAYGVLTPPTNGAAGYNINQNANVATGATIQHLSVPSQVMEKQYQFCSYLSQCHELWELADLYTYRGHCKDFIIRLDQTCGPLTLHSSLKELVRYTQEGLNFLSKEIKDDEMH